ncbi:related to ribosomal protein YmL11 precursor, mitochondrial [Phialocephala subalpina]|uniref:Related to ribosomal protein YmL11, mitochondrial n=1 Tax=Phialocephala subalpina TaxID=576137 RepID=A0A1L7XAN2_9HELO|nr:related to ribosomal protein YmL11 precursor, mitochondrial [Phialocephala subalpina]
MPPRIHPPSRAIASILKCKQPLRARHYATAAAITPAASHEQMIHSSPPIARFPSTQPPSYKPPEFRKSQLLRQYASLLRSTPLMLLFQHNNLKSQEWVGLRRELTKALRKVDEARVAAGHASEPLADGIKIQIIQTGIFAAALRIVEFYKPDSQLSTLDPTDPATPSPATLPLYNDGLTHTLSAAAHEAVVDTRTAHALAPLLSGPLMLLTFPNVSPQHMKAAMSILAPSAPDFPAPTRRANPGWHDPGVQSGLQKLLLLGARVEGKVFDVDGTKWVGKIEGGLDGLRAQLVAMLQGAGAAVTNTLESAGRSLYFTVEGRRTMLEDEEKGPSSAEEPKE